MRPTIPLLCCSLIALPAAAKKAPDSTGEEGAESTAAEVAPPPAELIAAASAALGGPQGGGQALVGLPGYRLTYDMDVTDHWSGQSFKAKHEYVRGLDASLKLEVKVVSGDGKDSVAYLGGEEAWVEADGERTDFTAEEVRTRIDDFAAETLFQVPLDLAVRGIEALPEPVRDRLISEVTTGEEGKRHVVRAEDTDGQEAVRLVLDPESHLPLEASFTSQAGRITYRFGDYKSVAEGLVLPHARTFFRNDVQLSELTLRKFEVLGKAEKPKRGGGE